MHLSLLEYARNHAINCGYNVLYGLLSPVHGAYGKPGLATAQHRVAMARLAVDQTWVEVASWESERSVYSSSWEVVDWVHADCARRGYSEATVVFFACGADLLLSMTDDTRWPPANVHRLLDRAILAVAERPGSNGRAALNSPVFQGKTDRIVFIDGVISDISSSIIRYSVYGWLPSRQFCRLAVAQREIASYFC